MKKEVPRLETERLFLDDITEEDTDLIVKWRSDPLVYRFFADPHRLTAEEHLNWYQNSYIFNTDRFDYMARVRDTGKEAVIFGIKRIDDISAEVSYILAPEEQGKGYASEAVARLLSFISVEWHCRRALAEIHKDNLRSLMFAEKSGFAITSAN